MLLLLVIGPGSGKLQAQDPVFSQFYAAPLQLNPAFAGISFAPRLSINYRNQYPGWPNAYITYSASYEQAIGGMNSGIGINLMADAAGDGIYKTNFISGVYGYQVRIGQEFYAKLGIEAGILQTVLNWDRLVFGDQIDPLTGPTLRDGTPLETQEQRPGSLTKTSFDVGAGILLHGGPFYGGLSVRHLNQPDESILELNENLLSGRPLRWSIHGGTQIDLSAGNNRRGASFISPNVLYMRQASLAQLNIGAYAGLGRLFGGIWYRHAFGNPDAFILSAGLREGILRIAYSYDFTLSELATAPGGLGGTHEISLAFSFGDSSSLQRRRQSSRWNDCFGMFR